jgi:hypothetical protein
MKQTLSKMDNDPTIKEIFTNIAESVAQRIQSE